MLPNVRGSFQEIAIVQRLADNEKDVREKALNKLRSFLSVKSSKGPGFSEDDCLKIWKGLFYCMYNADKPLVQEYVAEKISFLIHDLQNYDDCFNFSKAAFQTFVREWDGIDNFRIDKYMMFMRRVLRQIFEHLKMMDWNLKEVDKYMNMLENVIIQPGDHANNVALGIKLHLSNIILEELAKVGEEELDHAVIVSVIQPYFKVVAMSKNNLYISDVCEKVIRHLIRQSDIGVQYEERLMGIDSSNQEKQDEEEANEDIEMDDEEQDGEDQEEEEEEHVLDPRAGEVNAAIPQIYPDFKSLAVGLQKLAELKRLKKKNCNLLYKLVKEFKDISEGVYPYTLQEWDDNLINDPALELEDDAVERLKKFHEDLHKPSETKLEDLKDLETTPDELSKYTIVAKPLDKKKKKKKQKGNFPGEQPFRTSAQKRKLAQEQYAAQKKRIRAIEGQIIEAKKIMIKGNAANSVESRKENKDKEGFDVKPILPKNKNKKNKKNKQKKENTFEVKTITEDSNSTIKNKKKRKKKESESTEIKKPKLGFEVTDIANAPVSKDKSIQKNGIDVSTSEKGESIDSAITFNVTPCNNKVQSKSPKKNEKSTPKREKKSKKDTEQSIMDKENNSSKDINIDTSIQSPKSKNVNQNKIVNKSPLGTECKKENMNLQNTMQDTPSKKKKKAKNTPVKNDIVTNKKQKTPIVNGFNSVENTPVLKSPNKKGKPKENGVEKTPVLKSPNKKGKLKENGVDDVTSTNLKSLKDQDIEIFLKNKRVNPFTPKSTPKANTGTPKRRSIKINLLKNKEHSIKDYIHSVQNSPDIPYNAEKRPEAPVLKPSPSPILLKGQALKFLKKNLKKVSSPNSPNVASPLLKNKSLNKKGKFPKQIFNENRSKAADFF